MDKVIIEYNKEMVLNIVKNNLSSSCITECVREIFDKSEVSPKKDYGISVDVEVKNEHGLHSLEGLKELECYFKDFDIRIW